MGNYYSSNEAKGAGQDVVKQTEKTSHPIYQYIDLKGGGKLMSAFRRCQASKDYTEVDKMIKEELKQFLYDEGKGKMIAITDLVEKRTESRENKSSNTSGLQKKCSAWCTFSCSSRLKTKPSTNSEIQLINKSFSLDPLDLDITHDYMNYRLVCWNIDSRGAVGESLLHLCFLNATKPHYDLAKILLDIYPSMIHDIYISDEYYGENCLHMAIVNENMALVHYLCQNGINIHERAYGAFFCPEDQKDGREDNEDIETINLDEDTNYQSHTYFGEYPLSFAACLGHKDPVMYLLRRKACPNKKDTNGNTVLHMVVIHDRPDMYDLLLDYGCYCECCHGIQLDIQNVQGLTPLALAAKLAKKEIFQHMITKSSEMFWEYGGVSCSAFPLQNLDTTDKEGIVVEKSALNIIVHEDSSSHLELFDGIIHQILDHKWKKGCRFRFFQLFFLYIIYLIIIGVALYFRPSLASACTTKQSNNSSSSNSTEKICDPCYLRKAISTSPSQTARGVFEILANLWALMFLIFIMIEMISQGFKTVGLSLLYNPIRGLFALSCTFLPVCFIMRFLCLHVVEDYLTIMALMLAWPYALMFCKGFALTGPYVVMIYQMLKKDFIIFFIIYMIFVIGFSQAMYLVSLGYIDSSVKEHMFSRWFSSGLGLIIMSLGEFGDLNEQLSESDSPFKVIGLIMFFAFMVLGALLIVNMLIAMMGNTYSAVERTEKEWTRQWARIVLTIERMFSPKQKLKLKQSYAEPFGSNGESALIMKQRKKVV